MIALIARIVLPHCVGEQEDLGGDEGGASIVPQTGYLELKDSAGHAEMAVVSAEEVGVGGLGHLGLLVPVGKDKRRSCQAMCGMAYHMGDTYKRRADTNVIPYAAFVATSAIHFLSKMCIYWVVTNIGFVFARQAKLAADFEQITSWARHARYADVETAMNQVGAHLHMAGARKLLRDNSTARVLHKRHENQALDIRIIRQKASGLGCFTVHK